MLFPNVRPQFFTSTNALAAGYKLFFYQNGTYGSTNTKQNTTDGDGGSVNPNPIILDASGRPDNSGTPIDIFLLPGASYDVVLAPANDTDPPASPEWTVNNVQSDADRVHYQPTVAAMSALTNLVDNQSISTLGYTTPGDGGANDYFYDADNVETVDNVFVFSTAMATGRIVAKDRTHITALQAGGNIQNIIDYFEANDGGVVELNIGDIEISTALDVASKKVSIKGAGAWASSITCDSCNGINITTATHDGGSQFFEDFAIVTKAGSTANWAAIESILPPGGVSGTDSRDGLHFNRLRFYDWNQCFVITDTWEWSVNNCKAQKINQFIELGAYAYVGRAVDNFLVHDGGDSHSGTADTYAFDFPGSTVEGFQARGNQVYGFSRCFNIDGANTIYTNIIDNDLAFTQYGVYFVTAQNGLNIKDNYFGFLANSAVGIFGAGLGSEVQSVINAKDNSFIGGAYTGTIGIQGNTSGTTFQHHWRIKDNIFVSMTSFDIKIYNAGDVLVAGNQCISTGLTYNISVTDVSSGFSATIRDNEVAVAIQTTDDDIVDGQMHCYNNNIAGTVEKERHRSQLLTGPGAVNVTCKTTRVATTGADALTLADGIEGQDKFIVMSSDGGAGTLTPTNLGNGTTITFDDVGDSAHLHFTNGAWHFVGGTATLA